MHPKQQKLSLKNRALRFLSLREHSRLELGRKLARFAEEGDDVDALLDFLENKNFLSGERFSESLVRRRLDNYGNQRILAELQTHQLDPEVLAQKKVELAESEVARACAVWKKKFGRVLVQGSGRVEDDAENDNAKSLKQLAREERAQQVRYLAQRGFSSHSIKAAISGDIEGLDVLE